MLPKMTPSAIWARPLRGDISHIYLKSLKIFGSGGAMWFLPPTAFLALSSGLMNVFGHAQGHRAM
jgi:hypothetical protein